MSNSFDRRPFISGAGAAGAALLTSGLPILACAQSLKVNFAKIALNAAIALLTTSVAQAVDAITVASWSGEFQKAQRNAWFTPIEKAQGITIKEDTTSGIADVVYGVCLSGLLPIMLLGESSRRCRVESMTEI